MDKNLEGICPTCGEHTTAGDSCCGDGAMINGTLITDQDVWDTEDTEPLLH